MMEFNSKMTEHQIQFEKLWKHASGTGKISEVMTEIHDALFAMFKHKIDLRHLQPVVDRIANSRPDGDKYIDPWAYHGSAMILKVEGEWHITNSDLCLWRDICFFGDRDYFPNKWNWISSQITDALHSKRRWQTLSRYEANGGLSNDHKKLLAALKWDMSMWRGDGVSLYVGGKRPFGNSSIDCDMFETLGWDCDWEKWEKENYEPVEETKRAWELFDELQFAIIDVLSTLIPVPEKETEG